MKYKSSLLHTSVDKYVKLKQILYYKQPKDPFLE